MSCFIAEGMQSLFTANQLDDFNAWWNLDVGWFEPRNERRGGWSGVSRLILSTETGVEIPVFLKRQQNHTRRTLRHPISGEQTFVGEFRNMQQLAEIEVASLEPIYFAQRESGADRQTILVTRELSDYQPLNDLTDAWYGLDPGSSREARRELLYRLASLLRRLHKARWVHNCLYPKHVFVHPATLDVRLIDLEKMRRVWSSRKALLRDLDTLNRRSSHWSRTDRLRFLLRYLQRERVDANVRQTWLHLRQLAFKPGKQ